MNTGKGTFIVFEGLDGSGKSTQARRLAAHLESAGRQVIFTHEPTLESEAGRRIRRTLQHEEPFPEPEEFQLLYVEDRRIHTRDVILPALESGTDVVGDRYVLSTVAYGTIGGCDLNWLYEINAEFPRPDITFIIDASPEVCLERIGKRAEGLEYFERHQRFSKARETYRTLPSPSANVHLIDGERSEQEVFRDVLQLFNTRR